MSFHRVHRAKKYKPPENFKSENAPGTPDLAGSNVAAALPAKAGVPHFAS
jgi:hypothetical protein